MQLVTCRRATVISKSVLHTEAQGVNDYLIVGPNTWANWAAIELIVAAGVLRRIDGLGRVVRRIHIHRFRAGVLGRIYRLVIWIVFSIGHFDLLDGREYLGAQPSCFE